jgi:hypothetical protein
LSFFHRVVVVIAMCLAVFVLVSLLTRPDVAKGRLVWTELGGHQPGTLARLGLALGLSLVVYAVLASLMVAAWLSPLSCACLGGIWTWCVFVIAAMMKADSPSGQNLFRRVVLDDRCWAGLLCAAAIFMMYFFY